MPQEQAQEEMEMWQAPLFRKSAEGVTLEFSLSFSHCDLSLSLERDGSASLLVDYALKDIISVKFEQDAAGRPWFHATDGKHRVAVAVEPAISLRIRNTMSP